MQVKQPKVELSCIYKNILRTFKLFPGSALPVQERLHCLRVFFCKGWPGYPINNFTIKKIVFQVILPPTNFAEDGRNISIDITSLN